MTNWQDERTEAERESHHFGVSMIDTFLSGWGGAEGGLSRAVWACRTEHIETVEKWVRSRGDARRVQVVRLKGYRPRCKHCHIYVVRDGHPSLAAGVAQ